MQTAPTIRFSTLTLSPAIDRTLMLTGPLKLDAVQQLSSERQMPGGKGLNAARTLATCAIPVTATGLVGADAIARFNADCIASGVDPHFITVKAPTRVNMMLTDGAHELKVNCPPFPDLAFNPGWIAQLMSELLANNATHVIASGSLPDCFPPDTYAVLTERLGALGVKTVVDTAPPALRYALETKPWIIKPNRHEAEALLHRPLPDHEACADAARHLAKHAGHAILSNGEHGAWFATSTHLWHAPSPAVTPVDTTAAGDTLLAYACAGVAGEGLTPRTMAMAVAAGAAATEIHGSTPPDPQRVAHLASTITPRQIL